MADSKSRYDQAVTTLERETEAKAEAERLAVASTAARDYVQQASQTIQQEIHDRIADKVSHCLQAVFDDPYEFRILFERKHHKTAARLTFYRDGEEFEPTEESGLGVVDVAAFALRIAGMLLIQPQPRLLLVLDEPFRFVDAQNSERVRELIETLQQEMNVQIIMVTHNDLLACGEVYRLPLPPS